MKTMLILMATASLVASPALAHDTDWSVADVVAHYSAIGATLSKDSTEGIAEHAKACLSMIGSTDEEAAEHHHDTGMMEGTQGEAHEGMHGEAHEGMHEAMHGEDGGEMHGADSDHHAAMMEGHAAMMKALQTLADPDTDLKTARAAYEKLSKTFIPIAEQAYDQRPMDPHWVVMNCPMAKADWIQADGPVSNPYYGSKMPHCGKKVSDLASMEKGEKESSADEKGSMHHHGGGEPR
jgi:hypothetical protein